MWIEPVMGHYFLACNLLWPCSFIGTSDTELSGIHWSWKVSYMKSRVSQWSREKQRRWDTTWRAHAPLSCYITNQPVWTVPCTHPNKYIKKTWVRFSSACMPLAWHRTEYALRASNSIRNSLHKNYHQKFNPLLSWDLQGIITHNASGFAHFMAHIFGQSPKISLFFFLCW